MGDVTKNFSRHEWACECGCGFDQLAEPTAELVQKIRDAVGSPIKITSGCRCAAHNERIPGSAAKSKHLPDKDGIGWALDIRLAKRGYGWRRSNRETLKLYVIADQLGAKAIGLYHGRIHIDQRAGKKVRWIDKSFNWRDS